MKIQEVLCFMLLALPFGCATMQELDLNKVIPEQIPASITGEVQPVKIEYREKKVFIEKPVYVPLAMNSKTGKKDALEVVKESTAESIQAPDYWQGGMIIYDYDPTYSYKIFTQPLRLTDVQLEPGETVSGRPVLGDTTRWVLDAGVSYVGGIETQHIYLKPVKEGLETTLIINTNRRRYYCVLYSFRDLYMMGACWNYPIDSLAVDFSRQDKYLSSGSAFDPVQLCFDYSIKYQGEKPPAWLPERVFDDGTKTYIFFPAAILNNEMPIVTLDNGEIINFRVIKNHMILDRLIAKIGLKLNSVTVNIGKRGQQ